MSTIKNPVCQAAMLWWRRVAVVGTALFLAACGGSSQSAASSTATPLATVGGAAQPLTFYLSQDTIEPFAPFYVQRLSTGQVATMGSVTAQGADYTAVFTPPTWQATASSNGFVASDPLWGCDQSPDRALQIAPEGNFMARSCPDGSLTIFALPAATAVYHQGSAPDAIALGARLPAVAFAPGGTSVALTDDGPAGPGQMIRIVDTSTWAVRQTLQVPNGLLTRPSWSPNGAQLAAVDLLGNILIWNAATGAKVGTTPISDFNVGQAIQDPSSPGPIWTQDSTALITVTPVIGATRLTRWAVNGGALTEQHALKMSLAPYATAPQLAPDGTTLFIQGPNNTGSIVDAATLVSKDTFALPSPLVAWGTNGHQFFIFTNQSTVTTVTLN